MKARFALAAVGLLVLASLSTGVAAQATTDDAADTGAGCTQVQADQGICLPSVTTGDEDPLVAGVSEAVENGNLDAARAYVHHRADDGATDETQDQIEAIVDTAGDGSQQVPGAALGATPRSAAVSRAAAASSYPGTIVGSTLDLNDTITYHYCGGDKCTKVGSVAVEFRYTINSHLSFTLSGDIDVKSGPSVKLNNVKCLTYYETTPFDLVVKNWSNCSDLNGLPDSSARAIHAARYEDGTLNAKYHPDYTVQFTPAIAGAASFQSHWRVKSCYISKSPGTTVLAQVAPRKKPRTL